MLVGETQVGLQSTGTVLSHMQGMEKVMFKHHINAVTG